MQCLDENSVQGLAQGQLTAGTEIAAHLESCTDCRKLVSWALQPSASGAADATPEVLGSQGGGQPGPAASNENLPRGTAVGRYLLLERIGAGGMGVVYLAYDPDLDRRIAIKLIRAAGADAMDADRQQRFPREARAMARPQHPEVIAVYDVGIALGRVFIAMEYVEGATLRAWLSARPHTLREVLAMFVRVGHGLAAAHATGLVHRDFKPDNVLVGKDGRVRVTDFGLARLLERDAGEGPRLPDDSPVDCITRSGQFLGSPAYSAPEQMEGAPVDPHADIFSFCVVLYEALYGERPFAGRTARALHQAILDGQVAEPPRGARVPVWLRRVVLRGLKPRPADRWESMEQLLAALGKDRRRLLRLGLFAAPLAALAGVAFVSGSRARVVVERPAEKLVAMLDLKDRNSSPDSAWLSTAIGELVSAELHAAGGPRVSPGEDVARMQRELHLSSSEAPTKEALQKLRGDLPVDYVVAGEYSATADGALEVKLGLIDAASGRELAAAEESGRTGSLFEIASRAGRRLRAGLGVPALNDREHRAARASLPSNPDAARAYARALFHFRAGDSFEARAQAERSVKLEPSHAFSHLLLARSQKQLGYLSDAGVEARRALDASDSLDREDQLAVELIARDIASEWDRAIEVGRALVTFYPARTDYALSLARVLERARRGKECLAAVEALKKRPLTDLQDPNLDYAEAGCAEQASDYQLALTAAERGVAHAAQRGAGLLAVRNRYRVGRSFLHLGQTDRAIAELTGALARAHDLGDGFTESSAMMSLGAIELSRREFAKATLLFDDAIALTRRMGFRSGELMATNDLANACLSTEPARAKVLYAQAAAIADEVKDVVGLTLATMNMALVDANAGEVASARRELDEALATATRSDDRYSQAQALLNLCQLLQRADDLTGAIAACDETEKLWAKTGDSGQRAVLLLTRANALNEQTRFAEAEAVGRDSVAAAARMGSPAVVALAELALAETLWLTKRIGAARQSLERARAAADKGGDPGIAVGVAIASGKLELASPRTRGWDAVASKLAAAAERAAAAGQILDARDARLSMGRALLLSHDPRAGELLSALEAEARAKGDLLVARKAGALRARSGI
jgi:serine/threonine protein kinase